MIRSALIALFALSVPMSAAADEDRDPRVEEILSKLPSEAEMEDMLEQMPDMNKMVSGVMEIAQDPETMETLERVGARLEERFAGMDLNVEDGEMPDPNLLMGEMMGLASDKESLGDVLGLMFQVVDVMEEATAER